MADESIKNILKVREDNTPLVLEQKERGGVFSVSEHQTSSWLPADKKNDIQPSDLRREIEPWLTSLFQSEHLSLLTGTDEIPHKRTSATIGRSGLLEYLDDHHRSKKSGLEKRCARLARDWSDFGKYDNANSL